MTADDPNAMSHHAIRLVNNPAWDRVLADVRRSLDRERDRLPLADPARQHISIAQTMIGKIERYAVTLTKSGKVEQFNATTAARARASQRA